VRTAHRWIAIVVAVAELCATACTRAQPFAGLIDVGGSRLYLECSGSGSPAVVLEADIQGGAGDWSAVQSQVAGFTLVCSYDRRGQGRSDRTTEPSGGDQAVDDLRVVLAGGGIRAPYVLVGNRFGGLLVQHFALNHPHDVAGLVLIDADDDSLARRFQAAGPTAARESYRRWMREDPDGRAVAVTYAAVRGADLPPGLPLVRIAGGEPDAIVQAISSIVRSSIRR
jgi:pimeloyl-ACP methyl ester carboxylesterase